MPTRLQIGTIRYAAVQCTDTTTRKAKEGSKTTCNGTNPVERQVGAKGGQSQLPALEHW